MLENGSFREDLYYRLNVVNIDIPPLRDRADDIPLLVDYFIGKYCNTINSPHVSVDQSAMNKLQDFNYPGNIRELENMIERAIVVGNGNRITLKDLPLQQSIVSSGNESLEEIEKKHIAHVLSHHKWNISRAAKALEIDRVTLYNKIKKYQLEKVL